LTIDNNGNLYASTLAGGLQRSTNGGYTWQQVLGLSIGVGASNRAADLEIAANGTLYATLGIRNSGAIFKSTSGARNTWQNISPPGTFQRIEIACAPSNSNRIYALCQGSNSYDVTNMYRSDNGGYSWVSLPVPNIVNQGNNEVFTRGQGWYNLIAAVDPNNANVICIGGVDALRSTNAGNSWEQITTWSLSLTTGFTAAQNIHADHHAIVYAPGNSSTALWGTDGGIYYTTDLNNFNKKPNFSSKNKGYNVTQFYSCAIHPQSVDYFLGGTQDNGTHQFKSVGMNTTNKISGGDGGFCHISQINPNIQISSYLYNNYYVSTDGGNTFAGKFFGSTGKFINPTDYDDKANKLYASHNSGKYLRWNDPAQAGYSRDEVNVFKFDGASPTSVLVSPNVNNRVYFGLNNGSVVRVDNAHSGTSHTGLIFRERGIGSVVCVEIEKGNENHALAIYSNYGVESIWETRNGGLSWESCEGDLPDMPVRWAMFAPDNADQALIATELGVWQTADLNGAATEWTPASEGLANVRVDMLQHRASDNLIIAATHGRGMFSATYTSVEEENCPEDFAQAGNDVTICEGNSTQLNASGGVSYQWSPSANLSCNNCPNPIANPSYTRLYTVTVTDQDDCTSTDRVIVNVEPCPTAECLSLTDIYEENFETFAACETASGCWAVCPLANDWTNETDDETDWRTDAGGTSTTTTGPSMDFAPGTVDGQYLYLESSSCYNSIARLTSPCFDLTAMDSPQLSLAYHAYGGAIGDLYIRTSTDAGNTWSENILIVSGNQSNIWKTYSLDLPKSDQVKIQIIGSTGSSYRGDMAIDNIIIKNKIAPHECPTNFAEAGENIKDCVGTTHQLNASGGKTYRWSPTNGLSNANIANPNITISYSQTYTVTVTDENNCTDTDQVTVTAYANPTANAGANLVICEGNSIVLNASGGTTYRWSPSTGLSNANIAKPTASPTFTTTYELLVTNQNGCTDTDQITITVKDCSNNSDCLEVTTATPYQENFDTFDQCPSACTADCELINDWLNEPNGATDDTNWLTNAGITKSGDTGPNTDYNTGTNVGKYLYVESTGCYNSKAILTSPCLDLSALNMPELTFAYHMLGSSMGDLLLNISDDGGNTWSGDFLIASGEQGNTWKTASTELPNTNAVMVRIVGVTGGYFRSDMAIDDIRIQNASAPPLAPLANEENTPDETATGLTVRPNPVSDNLTITLKTGQDEPGEVALYDLQGRKIWSENTRTFPDISQQWTINVNAYPAGLYVLIFKNSSMHYTEKVIIR